MTSRRALRLTLALILAAVLGLMAGFFAPTPMRSGVDRVLRIASALALSCILGLAIVAKRLPRGDVSRLERWLRALFFVGHS